MHGDRLVHSPACRRHLVTADCPVGCLAPLLGSRVVGRLARADGRRGEPVASCGVPATVGDVVRLHRQGRLGEIGGLGPLRIREIGVALVSHGLVAAEDGEVITPGCPVDCLRSVLSERALNRLARADGRRVLVAPGGPPATVGDVVRLYREGGLGEIAGLGTRGITEIEAGRSSPGFSLRAKMAAQVTSVPGQAAQIIRATMYRLLRLPEPKDPPPVRPVPVAAGIPATEVAA